MCIRLGLSRSSMSSHSQWCAMKPQPGTAMHTRVLVVVAAAAVALLLAATSAVYWQAAATPRDALLSLRSIRVQRSSVAAVVPKQLQGVPFNAALGCWHVTADARGAQSPFRVVAEANFEPGDRWAEVQDAILRTHSSNPGVHYILATKQLFMLELLASSSLGNIPLDVWYCPEVLYSTPVHIGSLYQGPKFALSIDNWLPPVTWQCTFSTSSNQSIVYVVQRSDSAEFSGNGNRSCHKNLAGASADGLLYDHIPPAAVEAMRFPRTYWGCESLALYILKRAGVKLVNLCPFYAPIHMHKDVGRDPQRLRINHPGNSVGAGESLDMDAFCQQRREDRSQ